MSAEKEGKIVLKENGQVYRASWRLVGPRVEISSDLGEASPVLGALTSAPATVAREHFREMVKRAMRPAKPAGDRARFDIRDR